MYDQFHIGKIKWDLGSTVKVCTTPPHPAPRPLAPVEMIQEQYCLTEERELEKSSVTQFYLFSCLSSRQSKHNCSVSTRIVRFPWNKFQICKSQGLNCVLLLIQMETEVPFFNTGKWVSALPVSKDKSRVADVIFFEYSSFPC